MAAILGTNQSLLEAVLLKRRVVGPAWLALSKPVRVDAARQVGSSASCGLACAKGWATPARCTPFFSPMYALHQQLEASV